MKLHSLPTAGRGLVFHSRDGEATVRIWDTDEVVDLSSQVSICLSYMHQSSGSNTNDHKWKHITLRSASELIFKAELKDEKLVWTWVYRLENPFNFAAIRITSQIVTILLNGNHILWGESVSFHFFNQKYSYLLSHFSYTQTTSSSPLYHPSSQSFLPVCLLVSSTGFSTHYHPTIPISIPHFPPISLVSISTSPTIAVCLLERLDTKIRT